MDNKERGTAFAYPTIGEVVPDDYVMIRKSNGRIAFVSPEEACKEECEIADDSDQ